MKKFMDTQERKPCTVPRIAPGMTAPVQAGELAVVVGAGTSGLAAVRLLAALGARVRLLDKNPELTKAAQQTVAELGVEIIWGEHTPSQFTGASVVVTSPGVPLSRLEPLLAEAGNPPLIAEMELALRYTREPILAITGTSGKTTTVSLAAAMLEAAGKNVFLGGNIGTPLSSYVLQNEKADVLVLELSSFQLQAIESLRPKVAAILNFTENHLDHHKDMAEYATAKFRIFALQTTADLALLPSGQPELAVEFKKRGFASHLQLFSTESRFSTTRLAGRHNAANAEAAYLACREFGVSIPEAASAVSRFIPLPHRLEAIGEIGGIRYVNDSKCTTVEALRAALSSFDAPVVLMAGGKFKGGDLLSLRELLKKRARAVVLFGASRDIFEKAWQGTIPLSWDPDMPSAMVRARTLALSGDVVLLSPATSSYDLYRNYMERGDHFRRLAHEIESPGSGIGARP